MKIFTFTSVFVLLLSFVACEGLLDDKNETYLGHFIIWVQRDNSIKKIETDTTFLKDSVSSGVQMIFLTDKIIDFCKFNGNKPSLEWVKDNYVWSNPEIFLNGAPNIFEWSVNGVVLVDTFKYSENPFALTYPLSGMKITKDKSLTLKWEPSRYPNQKIKISLTIKNDVDTYANINSVTSEVDDKLGVYTISLSNISENLKPGSLLEIKAERYFYTQKNKKGDLYLVKFNSQHIIDLLVVQ